MKKIPLERHITKRQLWEKIDNANKVTNDIAGELYTAINGMKDVVTKARADLHGDSKEIATSLKTEIYNKYLVLKKEMVKLVEDTSGSVRSNFSKEIKKFDNRFGELLDLIPKTIYLQMEERIGHLSTLTQSVVQSTEKYTKLIVEQINDFQVETRSKNDAIQRELKNVRERFKLISKELS